MKLSQGISFLKNSNYAFRNIEKIKNQLGRRKKKGKYWGIPHPPPNEILFKILECSELDLMKVQNFREILKFYGFR